MLRSLPLTLDGIHSTLETLAFGRRIELFDRIDSTNREAFMLAQADVDHGTLVVAEGQTDGRGRLGRTWFSPPGVNLYCSVVIRKVLPPDCLSAWLSWLPLTTAVATAESLESVAGVQVMVKWPNDLMIGGRKVGGILCESGTAVRSGPFQVVGIGLNVNGHSGDFPMEIRSSATTVLDETGRLLDRNRLLAQLLLELEQCIDELAANGQHRIAIAYQKRCTTLGQTVRASLADGKEFTGVAEAIDEDGSIQISRRPLPEDERTAEIIHIRTADIIHLQPSNL